MTAEWKENAWTPGTKWIPYVKSYSVIGDDRMQYWTDDTSLDFSAWNYGSSHYPITYIILQDSWVKQYVGKYVKISYTGEYLDVQGKSMGTAISKTAYSAQITSSTTNLTVKLKWLDESENYQWQHVAKIEIVDSKS